MNWKKRTFNQMKAIVSNKTKKSRSKINYRLLINRMKNYFRIPQIFSTISKSNVNSKYKKICIFSLKIGGKKEYLILKLKELIQKQNKKDVNATEKITIKYQSNLTSRKQKTKIFQLQKSLCKKFKKMKMIYLRINKLKIVK